MERWEQASEDQLELIKFFGSDIGRKFANIFGENHFGRDDILNWGGQIDLARPDTGEVKTVDVKFADQVWLSLNMSEPIYVSDDMMTLWEHAKEGFKPEPLLPSDMLTICGFVRFPRPIYVTDRQGKSCAFRAMSWYPLRTAEADSLINPDTFLAQEANPNNGMLFVFYSHTDDPDDFNEKLVSDGLPSKWSILHACPIWFGQHLVEDNDEPEMARLANEWYQPVQSFLRLTMQYIATHDRYTTPRATRKRWFRNDLEPKDVVVIRLRRAKSKSEPSGEYVEWSHRWMVRGFWRNQWFPSLQMHRQIYINEYIKGPEGAPLMIHKKRVFEFIR